MSTINKSEPFKDCLTIGDETSVGRCILDLHIPFTSIVDELLELVLIELKNAGSGHLEL